MNDTHRTKTFWHILKVRSAVAITIFWLGKYATKNYQGPQLDLSAYSAFVHHKHSKDLVDTDFHREQASTLSSQWDWSHGIQGRPSANSSSVDISFHHTRNSSYDSFEKESFDSLDETDGKMPMTRYSSASALNKTRESQNFSTFDSSYSNDRNSSLYRSSPDLTHGNSSHRRYSSTDSMDGSHNSGHSRQGSDAQEINYVTRKLSSQSSRKSSSSLDPLQFVKLKGANDLAYTAEVQMRVAAESKIAASVTRAKDDDADWQSDLSSWKNRRKSQSERTYQSIQDLEEKEEVQQTSAPKTFSQMQEERERRKSSGRSFYPIDDENDDAFAPDTSTKLASSSFSHVQTYPKDGISPWAKDSEDEDDKSNILQDRKSTKINGVNSDDQNDKNNNFSDTAEDNAQEITKSSSRSKLAEKLRAYDDDDNDTSFSKIGNTDKRYQRFKDDTKSNVSENNSNNLRNSQSFQNDVKVPVKSENNSKLTRDFTKQNTNGNANAQKDNYKRNESYGKAKDIFSKSDSVSDWDSSNQKITTVYNVGSRTQSKIGSIMKNFADSENKASGPKQGYNEKIDLGARKSAFMKESTDTIDAPVPARRSFGAYQSKEDSVSSSGDEEEEEEKEIRRDSWDSNKISPPSSEPPIPSSQPPSFAQKPVAAVTPASVVAPVAVNNANKKSVEKMIKISQKANSDKGFGFFLAGGVEKDAPITVSKVTLGSSADLNDLKVKDIILSVNQIDVSNKSTTDIGDIVAKAVNTGYIEMKISRDLHEDDFEDDEEDFSSSDEGEQDLQPPEQFHNIEENSSTSVMSQLEAEKAWLEQQIEDSARREAEDRKIDKAIQEKISVPSLDQKNKVAAQSHLTLSLDRYQDSFDDTLSPSSVNARPSPSSSQILDEDSDGSGPPAILRKWQRQRHKEEYTFDTGAGTDMSETFKRISLNASLPRRESYEDHKTYDSNVSPQKWEKRLEDWNQQQDKQRLYGENIDFIDQAKVAEENVKLHEKYEQEIRKAEEKKADKKREEEQALQSQIDTARVLEERKAERRARIQQTAAEAAGTYTMREPPQPQPEKSHKTSMTLNINRQQQ
ncbi:hypothetical protein Btru_064869 [Bulinus truncatus]|nr:hypothetical protein Btru_064869 [Bulinus truncatus]